jgi:hypothetical protein
MLITRIPFIALYTILLTYVSMCKDWQTQSSSSRGCQTIDILLLSALSHKTYPPGHETLKVENAFRHVNTFVSSFTSSSRDDSQHHHDKRINPRTIMVEHSHRHSHSRSMSYTLAESGDMPALIVPADTPAVSALPHESPRAYASTKLDPIRPVSVTSTYTPAGTVGVEDTSLNRIGRAVIARAGRAARRGNLPFIIIFVRYSQRLTPAYLSAALESSSLHWLVSDTSILMRLLLRLRLLRSCQAPQSLTPLEIQK